MASVYERSVNGVVTERWDDGARTYTDLRPEPDTVRAYNAQENLDADARNAALLTASNVTATSSKLVTVDFPAMQAILNQANPDIKLDPSQEIKDLARAVRRLIRDAEYLTDGSD